ncbi:MAG TPA: DUF1616 domain-containing protein [Methanoregulaceae archaeon]|nr:DUF1616 domain-containing protein [Methanoregulaceae archaeon]
MATSGLDKLLSWVLLIAVVAAIGLTVVLSQLPPREEPFTEFYLLGNDGIAEDYLFDLRAGQGQPVIMGITNHEGAPASYVVEVWAAHETIVASTNRTHVDSMTQIGTVRVDLLDGQTYEQPYQVTVSDKDANKVEFLLFFQDPEKVGSVPPASMSGQDRVDAAYRNVNLWIAVN